MVQGGEVGAAGSPGQGRPQLSGPPTQLLPGEVSSALPQPWAYILNR